MVNWVLFFTPSIYQEKLYSNKNSFSIKNVINKWRVKFVLNVIFQKSEDLYKKYTKCKICNSKRSLKRYYGNQDNYQVNENYIKKKQR